MANKEIGIVLKVVDQATAGIKKVSGELSGFAERNKATFQKMSVAGTVAFGAISTGIGFALKEAVSAEAGFNRLSQILKTTTNATDEQILSLKKQAEALEKVGVVSAGNAIAVQSQLATFDLQVDTLKELTPAILNYVTAEKGATASTDDFKSMTNGLAQALQGNFASLTKTGFVLDDATKALISNGTEAERAAALVDVLNSTYKDFNENLRDTAEGQMQVLRNSISSLGETIGNQFLPILKDIVQSLSPLVDKLAEWVQQNPELTKNLILGAAAITGLIAVLGTLGLVLPSIIAGFGLVTKAVIATKMAFIAVGGPITILIALMAVLVTMVISNREQIKQGFLDGVEALKIIVGALGTYLQTLWMTILSNIRQFMDNFLGFWREGRNAVVDFVMGKVNGMVDRLSGALDRVLGIVRSIKNAFESAKSMVGDGVSAVTNFVTGQRQFGGTVQAGKSYLVGERGPEIITPASTSKVQTEMGGGFHVSINMGGVTVTNDADENRLVQKITDTLTRQAQLYQFGIN